MLNYRLNLGLIFALSASPALADLTAEEVLADQLNLLSGYGTIEMATTGTVSHAGGLTVDGFLGSYRDEDDDTNVEIRIDGVDLVELPDGSVRVVYPDQLRFTVSSMADGEPKEVTLTIDLVGMSHIVSGSAEDLRHDISFDNAALGEFAVIPPAKTDDVEMTLAFTDVDATLRLVDGDVPERSLRFDIGSLQMAVATLLPDGIEGVRAALPNDQTSEFDSIDMTLDLTNAAGTIGYVADEVPHHTMDLRFDLFDWKQNMQAEGIEGMNLNMSAEDFALRYDVALSIEAMQKSFSDAIMQGQRVSGAISYARMVYDLDVIAPEGPVRMASSGGNTRADFSLGSSGIALESMAADTVVEISGPMRELFPLGQVGYEVRSTEFNMNMPILPSEDTQPFALKLAIEGLTTAEEVWSLFDPTQRLPRDPVDLVIDMEGQAVVTSDVFDDDTRMPFQNSQVTLNALRLAVAGAVLTGSGSVIDKSTPGNPAGIGTLSTRLTGANTLLDTLVDMGLLPNEQAMAARMALGVVARAGDGPDTLVSTIEIKEDGSISANGQRIK